MIPEKDRHAHIEAARAKYLAMGTQVGPADRYAAETAMQDLYRERGLAPPAAFQWVDSPAAARRVVGSAVACYGPHDLYWLGHWQVAKEILGVTDGADPMPSIRVAAAAFWWWPLEDRVIFSERPLWIDRDAQGRVHSPKRQAVEFPDGWGFCSWHGVRIPREWICEPEKLTPAIALTWRNVEQRRCAAEVLGWDKIVAGLNPRVIDQHENPFIGTLLRADLPGSPGEQFLRVKCPTGRMFTLPVSKDVTTALQAKASTFENVTEAEILALEVET